MSPKRIQLKRTKGWRKPEGAIVVSRPSKWGNPWRVQAGRDAQSLTVFDVVLDNRTSLGRFYSMTSARYWAVRGFTRDYAADCAALARTELAGHDLACWCPLEEPCHADVLLEIANGGAS